MIKTDVPRGTRFTFFLKKNTCIFKIITISVSHYTAITESGKRIPRFQFLLFYFLNPAKQNITYCFIFLQAGGKERQVEFGVAVNKISSEEKKESSFERLTGIKRRKMQIFQNKMR